MAKRIEVSATQYSTIYNKLDEGAHLTADGARRIISYNLKNNKEKTLPGVLSKKLIGGRYILVVTEEIAAML